MKTNNFMEVKFKAQSVNESFARVCVASFCLPLNPTVDEINDIKTAVSEAVCSCGALEYTRDRAEQAVAQATQALAVFGGGQRRAAVSEPPLLELL